MTRRRTGNLAALQRHRRRLSLAPLILLTGLALAAAYVLLFSPLFWVRSVTVTGTKQVSPTDVQTTATRAAQHEWGPVITRSLVVVDPAAVTAELQRRFPDLANVTVARRWPDGLAVTVSERAQVLLWKTKDQYYQVDQTGTAFAPGQATDKLFLVEDSTGLPVTVGKQIVSSEFVGVLLAIREQLAAAHLPVASFQVPETTYEVRAEMPGGWYALFDTTRPIDTQVTALKLALKTQKPTEYADLRIPGRVYVK